MLQIYCNVSQSYKLLCGLSVTQNILLYLLTVQLLANR